MKIFLKIAALAYGIMINTTPAIGQAIGEKTPQSLIASFLYALYQTNQDALTIAKKYVALQSNPNELSADVRYQGIAEHLTLLRKGQTVGYSTVESSKPIIFKPEKDKIVPYAKVSAPYTIFSLTKEQEKNAYVLIENDKPLRYFLVQGDKIISFDYMMKGTAGSAYLLGY